MNPPQALKRGASQRRQVTCRGNAVFFVCMKNISGFLCAAVLVFPACSGATRTETFEVSETLRELQISNSEGNVRIHGAATEVVTVSALLEGRGTRIGQSLADQTLSLRTICGDGWFASCAADYDITAPVDVVIRADAGSGNASLAGMRADAVMISGSGDIEIASHESEALEFNAGSGDVAGRGIAVSRMEGIAGSGDVRLELDIAPQTVSIEAGSGNITLTLPADTYELQATSGADEVDVQGITIERGAARKLMLTAGSGNITIVGK